MPKIIFGKNLASEKGVLHLAALFVILILLGAGIFLLVSLGVIQNPLKKLADLPGAKKEPTVSLQTSYKNPFDKSAQYVNPFASYKNPFDGI